MNTRKVALTLFFKNIALVETVYTVEVLKTCREANPLYYKIGPTNFYLMGIAFNVVFPLVAYCFYIADKWVERKRGINPYSSELLVNSCLVLFTLDMLNDTLWLIYCFIPLRLLVLLANIVGCIILDHSNVFLLLLLCLLYHVKKRLVYQIPVFEKGI